MPDAEPHDWNVIAGALGLDLESAKKKRFNGTLEALFRGELAGCKAETRVVQKPYFIKSSHTIDFGMGTIDWYELKFELRVWFKYGRGPAFTLLREGTFRSWLKQFGYQDIEVGQHSLDFQLTIKGEEEELIRDVLLANVGPLSAFVSARRGQLPKSDGESITSTMSSTTTSDSKGLIQCKELIDLLAGMASADIVGMHALLALPGAEEGRGIDNKLVVRVPSPTAVDFYPEFDEAGARLRAHASVVGLETMGPVSCAEREAVESLFKFQSLPLALLADAELSADEAGIWLVWPHKVEDPEVLQAGAKLLALLANPAGQGAYR